MKKLLLTIIVFGAALGLFQPPNCPAPLIWRKGEGWTYEREGVATAKNPKDQLDVAQKYQGNKDYGNAIAAYRRLIKRWPQSSAAQDARFGLAESLLARGYLYKSFKEFQALLTKHPNTERFEEVLDRQYQIGNLFFSGARDKVWGVKMFPSLDKAVEIYEQVVKNGPYSKAAPDAQLRIGLTREKQKQYVEAVRAYEKLVERYPKLPQAEAAQFQIGYAYMQEAGRSEYDQNAANQSIAGFTEFLVRYPKSEKAGLAEQYRSGLSEEQAKGLFRIGQFYEKRKAYRSALIYYSEVIAKNPQSDWANAAQLKIARLTPATSPPPTP
jgi:outer membrane protein assembly factor BamD